LKEEKKSFSDATKVIAFHWEHRVKSLCNIRLFCLFAKRKE
jgi:hypothetical protein